MNKPLILIALLTLAAAGCSREKTDVVSNDEQVEFSFRMTTKAGSPSDDTYRTIVFRYSAVDTVYSNMYHGSYRQKDLKDWMTPCRVNNTTGEWIEDGSMYGLRAEYNSDSYKLCIATPAIAPNWRVLSIYSGTRRWGYNLNRTGDGIKISSPVTVKVTGNHLNGKYVYQADQAQLIDRRARLTVKLECGDDLASVHVNRLRIKNIYGSMSYDMGADTLLNPTLDAVGVTIHDTGDPEIELLHGEAATQVCSDFYLFALNYDRIDNEYHFLYDVPKLEVTMGTGVVDVPLNYNFRPQHSYTYTLSINSAFIKMTITSLPWNDTAGSQSEEIGEPKTEVITFNPGSWDSVDGGKGTI